MSAMFGLRGTLQDPWCARENRSRVRTLLTRGKALDPQRDLER